MIQISKEIQSALDVMGYNTLLPIQEEVIPYLLNDEDVIVKAKTGSGKTAAFAIPLCEKIDWDQKAPQVLVLACTRELVLQIVQEISEIGRFKKIKVASIIGKENMQYQKSALTQKCHFVVATPGRLLDHIEQGNVDLSQIRYVVLDEADYMLNLGFIEPVQEILSNVADEHVTALFSATFPEKLKPLLAMMREDAKVIKTEDSAKVLHKAMNCGDKWIAMQNILKGIKMESAIVFCNQQIQVEELSKQLNQLGVRCAKIHGGMLQKDRIKQLAQFKQGDKRILIATDVAARGIDIEKVSHVIHYDMPKASSDYIHRCGRSGRNDAEGCSILLVTKEDEGTHCSRLFKEFSIEILDTLDQSVSIEQLNKKAQKQNRGDNWKGTICKLHFNVGKEKKIRVIDIVGSLCSIDGVTQEDIGVIDVLQKFSFVEILNGKETIIVEAFKDKKLKNKNVKVEIAK